MIANNKHKFGFLNLGTVDTTFVNRDYEKVMKRLGTSFFRVFERVSRWSLRVSTPFSLLCLILLTNFYKSTSFPPNMLIYLNTTFTFGKQIKDNVIIERLNVGLHIHSLIFVPALPMGRVAGAAALG